jgi:hypothetical protein
LVQSTEKENKVKDLTFLLEEFRDQVNQLEEKTSKNYMRKYNIVPYVCLLCSKFWLSSKVFFNGWALVAFICNTSFSGGKDQEDHGLSPAQANSL